MFALREAARIGVRLSMNRAYDWRFWGGLTVLTQRPQFPANQALEFFADGRVKKRWALVRVGLHQRECRCCSPKLARQEYHRQSSHDRARSCPVSAGIGGHKRERQFGLRPRPAISFKPTLDPLVKSSRPEAISALTEFNSNGSLFCEAASDVILT